MSSDTRSNDGGPSAIFQTPSRTSQNASGSRLARVIPIPAIVLSRSGPPSAAGTWRNTWSAKVFALPGGSPVSTTALGRGTSCGVVKVHERRRPSGLVRAVTVRSGTGPCGDAGIPLLSTTGARGATVAGSATRISRQARATTAPARAYSTWSSPHVGCSVDGATSLMTALACSGLARRTVSS